MQTTKTRHQTPFCNSNNSSLKLKIPPPVYMLLFAGLMWLMHAQFPLAVWLDEPWNKLGLGIMTLSFIPAAGALRLFAHYHTTPNPRHPKKASKLVTSGVYRFSRNPMYLGLLLLLVGWAVYLSSLIATLFPPLFIWVVTTQQIKPEEQALAKVFGEEYLSYKQNVRRWS